MPGRTGVPERQRRGRREAASSVLVAVGLFAACSSGPSRGPVNLTEAILVNPTTISFGVPSCNGEPEVSRLDETATEVRIEVVSTVYPEGDSCADSIRVELEEPLGDREVIDLGGSSRMGVSGRV
jgi:hypothetical protein